MSIEVFVVLLVAGLFLAGAEIFVPGGVLGVFAALTLTGASIVAFGTFGRTIGTYITLGIVSAAIASIILWIKYFPRTPLGRKLAPDVDLESAHSAAATQ